MKRFKGKLTHPTTKFVGIPIGQSGQVSIDIAWLDATSSATITLETTGNPDLAFDTASTGSGWKAESAVTITGPAGSAAGSAKVHVSNLTLRARLKIVTAAACDLEIYSESY